MEAIKYLKEKKRMMNSLGGLNGKCIGVNCDECPLGSKNNGRNLHCNSFEGEYPEEAVAIVEKWAEEHPQKTILMDFLEKYPKALIDEVNKIPSMCPNHLGYEYECCINCIDCWNRPL